MSGKIRTLLVATVLAIASAAWTGGTASAAPAPTPHETIAATAAVTSATAVAPADDFESPCQRQPSAQTCDNTDPVDTGCNEGSFVANSVPLKFGSGDTIGYIQNWFSPQCGTNWARFVDTSGDEGLGFVMTCHGTDFTSCTDDFGSFVFPCWSDQVYSPNAPATAYVSFALYSAGMPAGASAQASATA
ncbi:MAG TPA: hypothetical protein VFX70_23235 [Mycobacteriales bacterium]|nr:hypothetical protein [Mycobacteriales bacterium]